jgi:diguanylate cyclase (GGDEF)-like protein
MELALQTRATEKPAASAHKDRRLRAVHRRELQNSVSYSALLVSIGIVAARAVRKRGRRYVTPLGMLVGLLPLLAITVSILFVSQAESIALGAFGLVTLGFAVFVPFDRRAHLIWLSVADLILLATVLAMWILRADLTHPMAGLIVGIIATALSMGANEAQLRRRLQMNDQLLAVRGLYGRMKEHELDLRRQDEFLFMQQETLVVQQAELLRLNEELETIARLDSLTGIGNRLRLNEDLAQLAARIERQGGTAGVLLMDLDRFKRLNDTVGHLAGDAALRGVADALRKTSRVGDGVYRYGGEEFLILLHDCDASSLRAAGERYVAAVRDAAMPHPDNPPYGLVTASAGGTELSQANCLDVDSALHDADEALYVAKTKGRNRLEIHIRPRPKVAVAADQQRAAS